jgi:cellulose synthase/poly-beta-1,6-N-acetylglucosamine synthase-like glycosyltransferase
MKKIMICIPHTGFIFGEHQTAILGMDRLADIEITWATSGNSLIYFARNQAAKMAMRGNYDYLLFIDSDMIPPKDSVSRLMAHDKDIVSGLYFKRIYPHLPVAYTKFNKLEKGVECEYLAEWEDGLMKIDAIGMGMCLIKVSALKKMQETYGEGLFDCESGIGEDQMFCIRARDIELDIWLDTTLIVPHLAITPITEQHYMFAVNRENETLNNVEDKFTTL